jgi:rRNA maturation protein Nop10
VRRPAVRVQPRAAVSVCVCVFRFIMFCSGTSVASASVSSRARGASVVVPIKKSAHRRACPLPAAPCANMYLMMYTDEAGKTVYTLKARGAVCVRVLLRAHAGKPSRRLTRRVRNGNGAAQKEGPDGKPTQSAHPARFSPDDKFSRVRRRAGTPDKAAHACTHACVCAALTRSLLAALLRARRSASRARSASTCCPRRSRRCRCEAARAQGAGAARARAGGGARGFRVLRGARCGKPFPAAARTRTTTNQRGGAARTRRRGVAAVQKQ